jgi:hypothetical protein
MLLVVNYRTMEHDIGKTASCFTIPSPSILSTDAATRKNNELRNYYKPTKYTY